MKIGRSADATATIPPMQCTDDLISQIRALVAGGRCDEPLSSVWAQAEALSGPASARKMRSVWRWQVAPILGDLPVSELRADVMATWEAELRRRGYASNTVSVAYAMISRTVGRLVKSDRLLVLPWRSWRPAHAEALAPREATRNVSELQAILRAARAADARARERGAIGDLTARVAVAGLQGLRQGELAALAWDDLEGGILHVRRAAISGWRKMFPNAERCPHLPKGRRTRSMALHVDAMGALRAQRERLMELGLYRSRGPVFPGVDGAFRVCPRAINPDIFRRIAGEAGFAQPGWVPHSLRHSAATMELGGGLDVRNVAAKLGHASIATTEAYLHASRVPAASAIARLEGWSW